MVTRYYTVAIIVSKGPIKAEGPYTHPTPVRLKSRNYKLRDSPAACPAGNGGERKCDRVVKFRDTRKAELSNLKGSTG